MILPKPNQVGLSPKPNQTATENWKYSFKYLNKPKIK